jgi:hypothetical protein
MGCLMKSIKKKIGFKNISFTKLEKAFKKEQKSKNKHRIEISSK